MAGSDWDLEVRPRRAVRTAWVVAVVIAVLFTIAGALTRQPDLPGIDQIAIAGVGWLIAAAVLLLTRPRVRVGATGVVVRNILSDTEFQWPVIRGVSIPDKKAWARLELVGDEYIPMLAFRVNDGEHAVRAMDQFRELGARYTSG